MSMTSFNFFALLCLGVKVGPVVWEIKMWRKLGTRAAKDRDEDDVLQLILAWELQYLIDCDHVTLVIFRIKTRGSQG